MMKHKNQMIPLAAAVAAAFAAPQAWAAQVVCDDPQGCLVSRFRDAGLSGNGTKWQISTEKAGVKTLEVPAGERLQIKLKTQTYQNTPATDSGIDPDAEPGYRNSRDTLIRLNDYLSDKQGNSELTVGKDTKIRLSQARDASSVVDLHNADAVLEKGSSITIDAGYGEAKGLAHPEKNGIWHAGTAIEAGRAARVKTSADIELNGMGALGLEADYGAQIEAADHKLALNGHFNLGLVAEDGGQIHARKVQIDGSNSQNVQVGAALAHDVDYDKKLAPSTLTLDNSHIRLPSKNSTGVLFDGGVLNMDNSHIEAEQALVNWALEDFSSHGNRVNLKNSTLRGRDYLIDAQIPQWLEAVREDDEKTEASRFDMTINAANSTLHGGTRINHQLRRSGQDIGTYRINLRDNSTWQINRDSVLDVLDAQDSTVAFTPAGNEFKQLEILGDLHGNATFQLNTDLANGAGDKLLVRGKVSGKHVLDVRNTAAEPANRNQTLTVVETGSSDADAFRLKNGTVSAGKYLYELEKKDQDWVLAYAREGSAPVSPPNPPAVAPVVPSSPNVAGNSSATAVLPPPLPVNHAARGNKVLSVFADSRIAHVQSASPILEQQNDTVNQRLAELHTPHHINGLWVLADKGVSYRRREYLDKADGVTSGYHLRNHNVQIGYDHMFASGAYAGVLAGRGMSKLDYRRAGFPDSRISTSSFGAYGGFTRNGWFADALLRHNRHHSRHPEENNRFISNSVMLQTGMQFDLGYGWRLVPQAALTLARVSGSGHTASSNLAQTRVGAELRGDFLVSDNNVRVMPFAGLYHLGDHHRARAKLNGEYLQAPKAGSRIGVQAGAAVAFDRNNHFDVSVRTQHGEYLRRGAAVSLGYRYLW
ncbi:autotransporter outer membrane beta-barrel domain-containing protein [Conchiformibius steedae DSM 2580]|uniref:Autotransporter outer membrane beta-barrel domain-containing protein n=1 Tax=Conchiformibius steedae DSM 2580 TaxID=1121352 RepID=A0AAE9HV89_9NEIS|nr:autotransporter outer membrane beta-barrel domain-containing protein [Conchiformibius steedae]QMT34249.1 autotransporter outer membrane beta-barrel domain-containing protein [Conchiformibius steedae]URD67022.1 autotransporter outer membrane beta-barrel domain-containing protein [Conchiformibius steedae DSM 2580]